MLHVANLTRFSLGIHTTSLEENATLVANCTVSTRYGTILTFYLVKYSRLYQYLSFINRMFS